MRQVEARPATFNLLFTDRGVIRRVSYRALALHGSQTDRSTFRAHSFRVAGWNRPFAWRIILPNTRSVHRLYLIHADPGRATGTTPSWIRDLGCRQREESLDAWNDQSLFPIGRL